MMIRHDLLVIMMMMIGVTGSIVTCMIRCTVVTKLIGVLIIPPPQYPLFFITTTTTTALAYSVTTQQHQHPLRGQRQQLLHHDRPTWARMKRNHDTSLSSTAATTTTTTTTISGGIIQERHLLLPNGITMQIICGIPSHIQNAPQPQLSDTPILLLLHGSFHSAWCYQEHYIPYMIQPNMNYIVIAPSWRGTAGTPPPLPSTDTDTQNLPNKVKIHEHVDDLYHLIKYIPTILQNMLNDDNHNNSTTSSFSLASSSSSSSSSSSPLRLYVVCHSFGGIVLMKYLEKHYNNINDKNQNNIQLVGIITMCSIPPSGNGKMTLRFLRRSIRQSYQITIGFAMKQCCTNIELCRTLFFDRTINDTTIQRYQTYFQRDSKITIDLLDLAQQLPSKHIHSENGTATFITKSSNHNNNFIPCCVIGALHDYIVDSEAVYETARYFGCYTNNNTAATTISQPQVTWIDSCHDVMLGQNWRNGATTIVQWIQQQEIIGK